MNTWMVMGANSFSGTAFCRYLESLGERVIEVTSRDLKLPFATMLAPMPKVFADNSPDYVVNFAALNMVAESWEHFADYYKVNTLGVAQFARACRHFPRMKKFVQVSTPEVYGTGATGRYVTEAQLFSPSTPYAVSRAAADMDLLALHRAQGFPVCFTRTVNVYGEGQQLYRIIPKTIMKILRGEKLKLEGGGVSTRSFIHIDDVCRGIYRVALDGRVGEAYHMAHPEQMPIRAIVHAICWYMGKKFDELVEEAPERLGKDMNYQLNDQKIRSELEWSETVKLGDRLPAIINWYRENVTFDAPLEYEHKGV